MCKNIGFEFVYNFQKGAFKSRLVTSNKNDASPCWVIQPTH